MAFVGRMLLDDREALLRPGDARHGTETYCPAWVTACAKNHARKYRRHLTHIAAHEQGWPVWREAAGQWDTEAVWEAADAAPGPEAVLLQAAVRWDLHDALARLAPEPCAFFVRHDGNGATAREIAADAGRTPHAVEACLSRAGGRLRALLGRLGVGETDLRFVFAGAPTAAQAC